jgi:hypothetical protein
MCLVHFWELYKVALGEFISIPALQIIRLLFFAYNTEKVCGIALMTLATLVKWHDCGRMGSAFFRYISRKI